MALVIFCVALVEAMRLRMSLSEGISLISQLVIPDGAKRRSGI
jgi:hypothetical protein